MQPSMRMKRPSSAVESGPAPLEKCIRTSKMAAPCLTIRPTATRAVLQAMTWPLSSTTKSQSSSFLSGCSAADRPPTMWMAACMPPTRRTMAWMESAVPTISASPMDPPALIPRIRASLNLGSQNYALKAVVSDNVKAAAKGRAALVITGNTANRGAGIGSNGSVVIGDAPYDPGTETWHMKELATIVPSALSTDQKKKLDEQHINTFLRYAGANITIGGYTLAGEWIDVIRFRDWLKSEMQINVFNALKVNRKVPFTDDGIGLIEGKMEETLKRGQDIGGIAPTEYDADDNEIPGYTVTVPRASDLTEAERKSRKLTGCRYTARLAGAIHAVEIEGFLTF